jgi:hypothetical protein
MIRFIRPSSNPRFHQRIGWKPGRPSRVFFWTQLCFVAAFSLAFLGRSNTWGVLAILAAAGLAFVTWRACATVALYPECLVVRPEGWPGRVLVFPLRSIEVLRAGTDSTLEFLDRSRGPQHFGPWVTLTGSLKGTQARCESIVETINEHLRTAGDFTTSEDTHLAPHAVGSGGNLAHTQASSLPTAGSHQSRRLLILSACYLSFPIAVFTAEWSGRGVVAAFSALLLFGVFQGLVRLAFHPRPSLPRVLLALVFGALQVVAAPLAARAGTAALRRDLIARLGDYEVVVSALQAKAANPAAQRVLLVDPHPDIAWADLDKAGRPQLALRHSLRQQQLVFATTSAPPTRDERGRCRQRLATDWYWYLPCCSEP